MLKRAKIGYKLRSKLVSHLLYIDDLKIYSKNSIEVKRAHLLIYEFSKDICMDFNLDKCVTIHINKGILIDAQII